MRIQLCIYTCDRCGGKEEWHTESPNSGPFDLPVKRSDNVPYGWLSWSGRHICYKCIDGAMTVDALLELHKAESA